jgi:hypothetical protein
MWRSIDRRTSSGLSWISTFRDYLGFGSCMIQALAVQYMHIWNRWYRSLTWSCLLRSFARWLDWCCLCRYLPSDVMLPCVGIRYFFTPPTRIFSDSPVIRHFNWNIWHIIRWTRWYHCRSSSLNMRVLAITTIFTVLASVTVAIRLWTRFRIVKSPGYDDLLIISALVCMKSSWVDWKGLNYLYFGANANMFGLDMFHLVLRLHPCRYVSRALWFITNTANKAFLL